ncbi:hypothetical protein V865_006513 [Kwoniella europaea PYCC6329]|uniref:GUN4-like domain-containing protein n=1 Tax=Kwoniella europaea PYCC6329 TaxID=1423913 RepID=A0AAX4KPK5_9TREE
MGTRGLLGFIVAGKRKACYNHYDFYPDRLGVRIVMFILALTPEQRRSMIERLKEIMWIDEEFDSPPSEELIQYYTSKDFHLDSYEKEDKLKSPAEFEQRRRTPHSWSELLRGMQGDPCLPQILNGELKHLIDQTGFESNWLCCEYAYWIDFENQTFEMTVGQEGKWTFDQLNEKGRYWRRLVDDELWTERLIEQYRESSTAQDMFAGVNANPTGSSHHIATNQPYGEDDHTHPTDIQDPNQAPDAPKESDAFPYGAFFDSLGVKVALANSNTMEALIDEAASAGIDNQTDGRA